MTRALMEGSEAIAEAALAAGCRFFAGYPMTPFTELLEHFAKKLPSQGGVCINAESELEAVGMAWGALATGARAATGSTGQGIALMQESLSEITRAELPLVVFNMARGQGDYFQATRGGGHGDYRHLVLAPCDAAEAVQLTQLAFDLADRWRNPVLIYGDYLLAHTAEAVEIAPTSFPPLPAKDWAVDGSLGGSGRSRNLNPLGMEKGRKGIEPEPFWQRLAQKHEEMARREARWEVEGAEGGAELVVVAFGTLARFARHAVRELRREGARVALFRPISLWPFPAEALRSACAGARRVAVLEQNAGQMIDDVRLALEGRHPVSAIGGISSDSSGFGIGPLLDPDEVRARIQRALEEKQ
ncbi:MAG TPA: transketolase C-terminal domain-containing protein [Myxococcota bacterium]|nr:transketolase C-terminal domain-containing protein [Myxococcota bacterium]